MEILLTGATGYVGGKLLRRLEQHGRHVWCLARRTEFLKEGGGPGTEVNAGDVLDPASLATAMSEVEVAYYLCIPWGRPEVSRKLTVSQRGISAKPLGQPV